MASDRENWGDLLNEDQFFPVRVYTLGRFEVVCQNEPLNTAHKVPQQPLTLLKAIIAFGGTNVCEVKLVNALWPDANGDTARIAFTSALSRLRQLLGRHELILRRDNKISLDVGRIWVDAWTVERLLERSEYHAAGSKLEAIARSVWTAADLHKGAFLSAENDAPWAQPYAKRLTRWLLRQLIMVGKQIETEGRPAEASRWYERALRTDPCAEDACRRLMIIYHRLGRRTEVVNVYQQFCDALRRELGMSPSGQTAALMNELTVG